MTDAAAVTDQVVDQAPTDTATPPANNDAPPSKDTTTVVDSGDQVTKDGDKPIAGDWPEDWRTKLAGGDDKILKRLERFGGVGDVLKWALNAEKKLSSGEMARKLGDNPTAEELAEYRKEQGIPEKPEEYDTNIEGLVFGDEDKPLVDSFLKEMHGANATPAQVKAGLKAYHAVLEQQQEARYENDVRLKTETQAQLKAEWGQDYKANINLMKGMLDAHGEEGVFAALFSGRTADGNVIGNDPRVIKTLVALARQINPLATVTTSGNPAAVDDEIAEIEKFMRTNRADYYKDERKQNRYRELLAAKEKLK